MNVFSTPYFESLTLSDMLLLFLNLNKFGLNYPYWAGNIV